jgi:hypothetical protein
MGKATYKDAGVDLDLYADSMQRVQNLLARTHSPRVMRLDGGFAGLFQLDFASPLFARRYEDPVLVSCTDGVGTKLKVATRTGVHNTVGIDLVAMSVNDALCCGAEPLFFLDYVAMSHDDPPLLEQVSVDRSTFLQVIQFGRHTDRIINTQPAHQDRALLNFKFDARRVSRIINIPANGQRDGDHQGYTYKQ